MKISNVVFGLVAGFAVLGAADIVWAWGPATHVSIARDIFSQLGLLPAVIAAILTRHRLAYFYGSIAADVVFAKRLSRVKQFCHHWSTAFRLLQTASSDEHRAFAYGYLSHLAADTVAHGKYVPRQIVASRSTVNFGHLYWELRADSLESEATWSALTDVLNVDPSSHHAELSRHMTDTFLPFEVNRALFRGMNALTVRSAFRRTIEAAGRLSRYPLSPEVMNGYRSECVDRVIAVLTQGESSPLLREDPNGTSAFMQVRVLRRDTAVLRRRKVSVTQRLCETSRMFAPSGIRVGESMNARSRSREPIVASREG